MKKQKKPAWWEQHPPWDPRVDTLFAELTTPPTKSDVRKWRRRARKQELTNEEILQYENAARKRGHIVPESKIYNRRKRIKKRKNKPAN